MKSIPREEAWQFMRAKARRVRRQMKAGFKPVCNPAACGQPALYVGLNDELLCEECVAGAYYKERIHAK